MPCSPPHPIVPVQYVHKDLNLKMTGLYPRGCSRGSENQKDDSSQPHTDTPASETGITRKEYGNLLQITSPSVTARMEEVGPSLFSLLTSEN